MSKLADTPVTIGNLLPSLQFVLAEAMKELAAQREFLVVLSAWLKTNPDLSASLGEFQELQKAPAAKPRRKRR